MKPKLPKQMNITNELHDHGSKPKSKAEKSLSELKRERKGKKFKLIPVDKKTWKEVEVKDE